MALQYQSRPEPMNATPHHSKVKVSVTLSDSFFIAGDAVTGRMELESRADKGLGLGIIMVELVAIEGRYRSLYPHGVPILTTFLRANFSRSFRNLNIPTHPSPFSGSWSTSFKCCPAPPRRRRAPSTGASPPRPARTNDLPLSSPSPAFLPSIHRFRKRTCQNTIRGPRLCWRRLERPEQARHRQVPCRRAAALPWRRRCHRGRGRWFRF